MKEKVVLAYSGGLDTSITIPWLKENYDLDVIAVCANVGQDDDMSKIEEKAKASGAIKAYVEDLREEFITTTIYQAIKAEVLYENRYPLGTALARPIIAKKLVEIAQKEGAKYICHGCTGKGNDQVRFEGTIAALDPSIKVIAPWRIWDIKSREDAIDYANEHNIEVVATKKKIYSVDDNLWHVSTEGGDIEYLENEHNKDIYKKTCAPEDAVDEAEYVEIGFEKGIPVSLNGEKLSPIELVEAVDKLGAKHGIGIVDILENRLVEAKPISQMLDEEMSLLDIAKDITGDENIKVLKDERKPEYKCNCSKEKMETALKTVGKEELAKILEEDKKAEIVCHFCNKKYEFNEEDLKKLIG